MSLALSICIFISLMQLINGAEFLNTTSLFSLFGLYSVCAAIDIVSLTSLYASL